MESWKPNRLSHPRAPMCVLFCFVFNTKLVPNFLRELGKRPSRLRENRERPRSGGSPEPRENVCFYSPGPGVTNQGPSAPGTDGCALRLATFKTRQGPPSPFSRLLDRPPLHTPHPPPGLQRRTPPSRGERGSGWPPPFNFWCEVRDSAAEMIGLSRPSLRDFAVLCLRLTAHKRLLPEVLRALCSPLPPVFSGLLLPNSAVSKQGWESHVGSPRPAPSPSAPGVHRGAPQPGAAPAWVPPSPPSSHAQPGSAPSRPLPTRASHSPCASAPAGVVASVCPASPQTAAD